ncbi:MAG: flagellar export chaperone FliS [Desulfobacula sp.]|uniref:flagellar export chaperone FliS n=1 Tax=Desulfobacula sp. TaxID=2593537 RepID=UPI0025C26ECD|nr:flagellar export chaperone FliS [Desulfobacula sp.]MCD4720745.1 flagellar export chaperone FliS [Desulfobacula sp.]
MVHGNVLKSYHKAQVYDEIDPNKLILMLYEGAIKRIVFAKQGMKNADPKQRGENLGKAIAIIAELNASLDDNIKTEEINFLRGLYAAMLTELPKVSVNEDIKILDRAEKYLKELKMIWETTVMEIPAGKSLSPDKNNAQGYGVTNSTYTKKSIAI